LILRPGGVSR